MVCLPHIAYKRPFIFTYQDRDTWNVMTDLVGKRVKVETKRGEETYTGLGVVLAFEPQICIGKGQNSMNIVLKVGWNTSECIQHTIYGDSTCNIGRKIEGASGFKTRFFYNAPKMSRKHAKIEVKDRQLILTPIDNKKVYILKWKLLNAWAIENHPDSPLKRTQKEAKKKDPDFEITDTPAPVFTKVEGSECLADGDQVFMGDINLDVFKDKEMRQNYTFKVEVQIRERIRTQCTKGNYLVKIGGTEEDAKLGAKPFVEYVNSLIGLTNSWQYNDHLRKFEEASELTPPQVSARKRKISDVECTGLAPWRGYMMLKREQIKVV